MGLYQRLTATDQTKISVHAFGASCRLLAAGLVTRQNLIDAFSLAGDDVTDLDALIASYTAITGTTTAAVQERLHRLLAMEGVFVLTEHGLLNEQQAKTMLGF